MEGAEAWRRNCAPAADYRIDIHAQQVLEAGRDTAKAIMNEDRRTRTRNDMKKRVLTRSYVSTDCVWDLTGVSPVRQDVLDDASYGTY